MQEIDINELINQYNNLNANIPNNVIIVGKIIKLYIKYKYNQLDLSELECNKIYYINQKGESMKNHKLPNSLQELWCCHNKLTSLPNLPNSLKELYCNSNQLVSLPDLPNSLQKLICWNNKLVSLPDLPNSLQYLDCRSNELILLPDLHNSLEELYCYNNQLLSLPDLPNSLQKLWCDNNQLLSHPDFTHIDHELELSFIQDKPISYIPYNKNIKLCRICDNKIIIKGYPYNPITNQEDLNKYMEYIKNYEMNRIKSARK